MQCVKNVHHMLYTCMCTRTSRGCPVCGSCRTPTGRRGTCSTCRQSVHHMMLYTCMYTYQARMPSQRVVQDACREDVGQ